MASYTLARASASGMALVFLASVSAAIVSHAGYNPFTHYVSDLGVGAGAVWFNVGMMLTSLFILSFFYSIRSLAEGSLAGAGMVVLGGVSSVGLFLVGVFPESVVPLHTLVSALFFVSAIVSAACSLLHSHIRSCVPASACAILTILLSMGFIATHIPFIEHVSILSFGFWVLATAWLVPTSK